MGYVGSIGGLEHHLVGPVKPPHRSGCSNRAIGDPAIQHGQRRLGRFQCRSGASRQRGRNYANRFVTHKAQCAGVMGPSWLYVLPHGST